MLVSAVSTVHANLHNTCMCRRVGIRAQGLGFHGLGLLRVQVDPATARPYGVYRCGLVHMLVLAVKVDICAVYMSMKM